MNTPKLKKTYKERKKKEILLRTIFTRISKSTTNIRIHHFKTTFMCPRTIAGVLADLVRSLRTTLLLRITCMHS